MTATATVVNNNKFIAGINKILAKCTGAEEYGDTTEFYDEDGVVLMTAIQTGPKRVTFTFGEDGESYEYDGENLEVNED